MGLSPSSGKSRTTLSEINVTPFVDVMLVLLVIFMVTAPLMQQGIEVDLPRTSSSGVEVNEDPLILVISAKAVISIGNQKIELSSLKDKLQAIFRTRKNKQIYIQADRHVDYGIVAETMAEIRNAGVFNIGLVTLPKQ
jgi:biopolymer transport protein TolR